MLFLRGKEKRGDWLLYKEEVKRLTEQTFKREWVENKELRGKNWHLDHKLSIRSGYEQGVPPEMIDHSCNLWVVPRGYNLQKSSKNVITFSELIEMISEQEDY